MCYTLQKSIHSPFLLLFSYKSTFSFKANTTQLISSLSDLSLSSLISMATSASVDTLVLGRVIDDVVDMFVPAVSMSVHYGSKHITNGCDIKPSLASYPPKIHISGHPDELYTLVMIDPDAPSPSEPTLREYLHWMVLDIPGGTNPARGKEIVSYVGPRPPLGIHRYIFVLYQQRGPFGVLEQPSCRSNFSTRSFACHMELGLPVATVYFNAQKEPANRKR